MSKEQINAMIEAIEKTLGRKATPADLAIGAAAMAQQSGLNNVEFWGKGWKVTVKIKKGR